MKLELKHLSAYMPYGVKFRHFDDERETYQICEIASLGIDEVTLISDQYEYTFNIYDVKPILRPMSDLDKTILTKDGYRNFAKINELYKDSDGDWVEDVQADYSESPSAQILVTGVNWWLFENHFDVFGLIEQNLAISINDLEK